MRRTALITTATALALSGALLAGCTAISAAGNTSDPAGASGDARLSASSGTFAGDLTPDEVLAANADYTTVNDDEWSEDTAVDVKLAGASASSASDAVAAADGVLAITAAGVYRLSGSFDGRVSVEASDDAQVVLILDGATITNENGAAIDVVSADDTAIFLAKGSKNTVSDAASYADDETANAAINADSDLTISGSGSLTVHGNGNDGISSTDDLVILSGAIDVTAADDALRGKDALVVEGGTLQLEAAGGDGLKSDQEEDETQGYILIAGGAIDVAAGDDGVQAQTDTVITGGELTVDAADDGVKGEAVLSVGDGTITVTASTEAMEAANIGIGGGSLSLTASDDGINASGNSDMTGSAAADQTRDAVQPGGEAGPGGDMGGGTMEDTGERLEISGGTVVVDAEGDGLDSNGSLTISGGDVTVYGPTTGGNGALDSNGEMSVTGGRVTAFGAGDMEETPTSEDSQGWVMISGRISAGQEVSVQDPSGSTIATFTSRKTAGSVIYSSPDVTTGESYALVAGGSTLGTGTAGEGGMAGGAPRGGAPGGQIPQDGSGGEPPER